MDNVSSTPDQVTIGNEIIRVIVDPAAGGRLAQITVGGSDLLVGQSTDEAMGWGSFPMVPFAGRVRRGRFDFRGTEFVLPANLPPHAIHGVGYTSTWTVVQQTPNSVDIELDMTSDRDWPLGGSASQQIRVDETGIELKMSVTATDRAMPASIGWHPWFKKPELFEFHPSAMYRRDDDGIAVDQLVDVPDGPWDDCFVNDAALRITIGETDLELTSSCTDWVIYDEPEHATCIEPQTGPPDALNIRSHTLEPGESLKAWYRIDVASTGSTGHRER